MRLGGDYLRTSYVVLALVREVRVEELLRSYSRFPPATPTNVGSFDGRETGSGGRSEARRASQVGELLVASAKRVNDAGGRSQLTDLGDW